MQLTNKDRRSVRTMLDEYLKAKKLSSYDQSLLKAGVNSNIVQEYASGLATLSAAYFDQVKFGGHA
jgi:hypothetical protein